MEDYRVNLEFYNGPLDLLLYLIRRDELDIHDIPISRITEQYLQYVTMIQDLDPNLAGEFLVLAATLMEIKTRMLLPTPPPEEGGAEQGMGIDPRTELVRQLLEYKAFKDAAGDLADAATDRAQKYARKPFLPQHDPSELDMEDVQVWDLLDAFSKLLTQIGRRPGQHEVIYDDTPVELHATDILDRLQREGSLTFARVFEGRTNRSEIVGLFIALLELVRQKKVFAMQEQVFGEIAIHLNPNPPTAEEEAQGDLIAGDQRQVDAGKYVPEQATATEPPSTEDTPDREPSDAIDSDRPAEGGQASASDNLSDATDPSPADDSPTPTPPEPNAPQGQDDDHPTETPGTQN